MKKVALVISLFSLIFAFTVSSVSAQKVTSAEKAKTTFNLLLELRNKFTDMYREVMRIQI